MSAYTTFPAIFQSKGINARPTDDTLPQGAYLDLLNMEELEENALCSRLGSVIFNASGGTAFPLAGGTLAVHSLGRLASYSGTPSYRYAGAGSTLYRNTGGPGAYTSIATGLSGDYWSSISYRPFLSSFPYLYIADSLKMLKDNGTTTQQMGIFQPTIPCTAVAYAPQKILIDSLDNAPGTYGFSNFSGSPGLQFRVNTTLTSPVTVIGKPVTVTVASTANLGLYQLLNIDTGGSAETVIVLAVTATGFTAEFFHTHLSGATVVKQFIRGIVPASTTASINMTGPYDLSTFSSGPTPTTGADYLAFYIQIDNPNNVAEIRLQLDVGNLGFNEDYYFKSIVPSVFQSSISQLTGDSDLVSQVIYQEAIGVYEAGAVSGFQLNTGANQWTMVLVQLSDLQTVGRAGLTNPGFTMANVKAAQVQVTTNTNGQIQVGADAIWVMGGYGPDSFGGVSYDYLYTYYNANTGLESNPSMFMSNINPPAQTTYVTPRRQFVNVTITASPDPQVTNIRLYRRGGTLAANFYRMAELINFSTSFPDTVSDAQIEAAATISFTNDVPVTSTLRVPVDTTSTGAITAGATATITVGSGANIFPSQQVTIGEDTDPSQEIVIVQSVAGTAVTAYFQNAHPAGVEVTAQSRYGQPVNLMALAYGRAWWAGDPINPQNLYYSNPNNVEALSAAGFIEVGTPSDPITAVVPFQGSLFVATRSHWFGISPITQPGGTPTVYPTTAVHGCTAPFGWIATETEIWHQSIDGIRTFAGGSSIYRSQDIEFLFQNNGTTPIVEADPTRQNAVRMTYWNNIVFLSYIGMDGNYHRLAYHTIYRRWRDDGVPATVLFTESDTNMLLYGDNAGLIHQDRVGYNDQGWTGSVLVPRPIGIQLITAYLDQQQPALQKQYNDFVIDANTGGNTLHAYLLFDDGQTTVDMGTFNNTVREKVSLNVNSGLGQQAYRVALKITGNCLTEAILYGASIRGIILPYTFNPAGAGTGGASVFLDTYWTDNGSPESKLCKQAYIDYTGGPITGAVYYDNQETVGYNFSLPAAERTSARVRFPAVKYRLIRVILQSGGSCQIWPGSKLEVKLFVSTKGYSNYPLVA